MEVHRNQTCLLRAQQQQEISQLVTYHFHCLDLRPSAERLFQNFHKDCVQRKIRRAERENVKYEDGASEDLLQKFYRFW